MVQIDPRFVAMAPLQEVIFDKDTGAQLSAGIVSFYSDPAFTVPKDVYQQSNTVPGTFTNLGSVLTLSSIGSFVDGSGNNIIPFLFPYQGTPDNSSGLVQLYYITVYSSGGILQFTMENWPPNAFVDNGTVQDTPLSSNQITNPQFVEFSINTPSTLTFTSAANQSVAIAPGWELIASGTGTVTVTQVASSDTGIPTQPPYLLELSSSSGITLLKLIQTLNASPRLFVGADGVTGIIAGSFVAASLVNTTTDLELSYVPSSGSSYLIVDATTTSDGSYAVYTSSVALDGTINTNSPPSGNVQIVLDIQTNTTVFLSSFQIVPVPNLLDEGSAQLPVFQQQSTPMQQNGLFYYWQPYLNFKEIPSLLTGWDFILNPAQGGSSFSLTGSSAAYTWDQTIVQHLDALTVSRDSTFGGINLVNTGTSTSYALIQYLDSPEAMKIIGTELSVNIQAWNNTSATTALARVYLYSAGSGDSFPMLTSTIGTLSADGTFTLTAGGNWALIPRGDNGQASSTLKVISTNSDINSGVDYGFSGWEITNNTQLTHASKFAIVVTFYVPTVNTSVTIQSISVVPGGIPTRPALQTRDEVLRECQYYYETSYAVGNTPINPSPPTTNYLISNQVASYSLGTLSVAPAPFEIIYNTPKRIATTAVVIYSSASSTTNLVTVNGYTSGSLVFSTTTSTSSWTFNYLTRNVTAIPNTATSIGSGSTGSGDNPLGVILYNFISDARIGLV